MTTVEILKAARAKIAKPENWCKGLAIKGNARCAMGALLAVCDSQNGRMNSYESEIPLLLKRFVPVRYGQVAAFNDAPETTHAKILALFDMAIAGEELKS